jgi:hypothetical protein
MILPEVYPGGFFRVENVENKKWQAYNRGYEIRQK